jgi:hypothetical protein
MRAENSGKLTLGESSFSAVVSVLYHKRDDLIFKYNDGYNLP